MLDVNDRFGAPSCNSNLYPDYVNMGRIPTTAANLMSYSINSLMKDHPNYFLREWIWGLPKRQLKEDKE